MNRGRVLSELVVLGLLIAGSAWGQGQTVALTFQDQSVTASGLTPGQTVVWLGVEHVIDDEYGHAIAQHYDLGTAAADGTARLDLSQAPAPSSLWIAVELDNGAYAVAAPGGLPVQRSSGGASFTQAVPGVADKPDSLSDVRSYVVGLVVRPGAGAWMFGAGDGGPLDADGATDGRLLLALNGLAPFPGSPAAPAKLQASDLWLTIDPAHLTLSVLKGGVAQ